jgi:hypothetical protein
MSYQPIGKRFTIDGEKYVLGIAEDDLGMRVFSVFRLSGGQWLAMLPVIADNLRDEEIMAHGSLANYINAMLPKAHTLIRNAAMPPKPAQDDKAMCLAYDCAFDLDFDPTTLTFRINKLLPLSHAR